MKDLYKTYDDVPLKYHYPVQKEYAFTNNKPTYEWDYGDSVQLSFHIHEEAESATIKTTILNSRFEELYTSDQNVNEEGFIIIEINSELSEKLFLPGHYYCKLQSIITNSETSENIVSTILPATMCSIYVR